MSTMIQDFQAVLKEKGVSEWTRQAYVSDVRQFLKFSILSELSEDNAPELAGKWINGQRKLVTDEKLAANTVKRREIALRLFCKEVLGVELVESERMGRVVKTKPEPASEDIWVRIGLPTLSFPAGGNWIERGACKNETDLFFDGRRKEEAKAICATCPSTEFCLDFALKNEIAHGVWGGKDENERKALLGRYVRERKNEPAQQH